MSNNKAENFAHWLNGFFELSEAKHLSENQITIIKKHLEKITISSTDVPQRIGFHSSDPQSLKK